MTGRVARSPNPSLLRALALLLVCALLVGPGTGCDGSGAGSPGRAGDVAAQDASDDGSGPSPADDGSADGADDTADLDAGPTPRPPGDTGAAADPGAPGHPLRALVEGAVAPFVDPGRPEDDLTHTVGMVVAVVAEDGEGVFGFGATEAGGTTPPGPHTLYQLGSVTKALTGLVLAQMVELGEVTPDARLDALLPELAGSGAGAITLQQLVTHYGGLPGMPDNLPGTDPLAPAAGYTEQALLDFLRRLSGVAPGEAYVYSNVGMGVLGLALRRQAGAPTYPALLAGRLLGPAGAAEVWGTVDAAPVDAPETPLAPGYAREDARWVPGALSTMGALAPAGEAMATGSGMLGLLRALTGHAAPELQAAVDRAVTPIAPAKGGASIGYGINVYGTSADGFRFEKGGTTKGGYSAYLAFRRSPRVGVAVLTNAAHFSEVQHVARTVLAALAAGH